MAKGTTVTMSIHATAIIERGACLANDVTVGPYAYIGPHVQLGPGCHVMHHAVLEGHTTAGRGNRFFPFSACGCVPQDLKYRGGACVLEIGDFNEIREHATLHIGTEDGGGVTRVGHHNLLMVNAHVAHDCFVEDHCILANNVMLAGHILVESWAIISGGAAINHFTTIGRHAFVGGLSAVVHDVPPYMIVDGNPASVRGMNRNGLKRRGFEPEEMDALKTAYRMLFKDARAMATQVELVRKRYPHSAQIRELLEFMARADSGKFGRYRETLRGTVPAPVSASSADR